MKKLDTNQDRTNLLVGISTGGAYYLSSDNCVLGDMNMDNIINVVDIIELIAIIIGE